MLTKHNVNLLKFIGWFSSCCISAHVYNTLCFVFLLFFQFDYFKTIGPRASQYIYAPPSALNGALNSAMNGNLGNSNQSPSPGYSQPAGTPVPASHSGPTSGPTGPGANASPGTAFYHTGGDLYFNGGSHAAPLTHPHHQPMYPMESSPAHSEVIIFYFVSHDCMS